MPKAPKILDEYPNPSTKYLDDGGNIVEVQRGLGDWWICARGSRRVKTKFLPPRKTAHECQNDLDKYAAKKWWLRIPPEMPEEGVNNE